MATPDTIRNTQSAPYTVTYYYAKPHYARKHTLSIEFLFNKIQANLPPPFKAKTVVSRYRSNGFWKRLYNTIEAAFRQGTINHIVGDVHFLALFLKKQKTILTIHDCVFMNHPSALARFIFRVFWLQWPVAKVEVVTVVSHTTKREVLKYVNCPPEKIRIIPNFISENFQPRPKPFRSDLPVILQIGTVPNKNLERLIEALQGIHCRLHIIGRLTPHQLDLLKQHQINYANFYNLVEEEVVQQYEQCDLLAFVSTYEGFGMPILEAQRVERPVVTANLSSMPEVAGEGACLVDPFDVNAIRNGILRVLQDEAYRNLLIHNGRENCKRYSLAATVQQYADLYSELCPTHKTTVSNAVKNAAAEINYEA